MSLNYHRVLRLNEQLHTHKEWVLMQAVLSQGGLLHGDLNPKKCSSAFVKQNEFGTLVFSSLVK